MPYDANKTGADERDSRSDGDSAVDRPKASAAPSTSTRDEAARDVSRDRVKNWGNQPMPGYLPAADRARADLHDFRPNPGLRKNPEDFEISLRSRMSTDQQLHNPGQRKQSMRGFEDHYTDIVDFIVRGTHRAWEEKEIGYVYDFYKHTVVIRDESGTRTGRDGVIASSLGLMNAFPDMRWIPSEIVWAGDDENGFHTSHRSIFTGTNTGWSQFGPPTGRRCTWWAVANCITIGNEVFDEWVIENSASMIQQLGLDVRQIARETSHALDVDNFALIGDGEPDRLRGQGKPIHLPPSERSKFDPDEFVRHMLHYVWNWRLVGLARNYCASNIRSHGPSGREQSGLGDYIQSIISRLAMFPDLTHSVDDLYWMGNNNEGYVVTVRWSITGTHTGYGIYGAPTRRRVHMWGISHLYIRSERIVEDWTMFNEFAVMQQLYRDKEETGLKH